jgi:hypothetical protein
MAEADLTGYWKGLAVLPTMQSVVHVYLEHSEGQIRGKFESPELQDTNTGDVTGSSDGRTVAFSAPEHGEFRGYLVGETPENHIIYGVLQRGETVVGTLTLFRRGESLIFPTLYATLFHKKEG